MQTLCDSAAAGVAKRLANEKTTLVRSSTPTTVPARTRLALANALSCHIDSIKELRSATATASCAAPTAADAELQSSASTPRPTKIRHASRPSRATPPRHAIPTLTHDGSEPAVSTHTLSAHQRPTLPRKSALTSTTRPNRFAALNVESVNDKPRPDHQEPTTKHAALRAPHPIPPHSHDHQPSRISDATATHPPTTLQDMGIAHDQQSSTPPATTTTPQPIRSHDHNRGISSPLDATVTLRPTPPPDTGIALGQQPSTTPQQQFVPTLTSGRSNDCTTKNLSIPQPSPSDHNKRPLSPNAVTTPSQRS